MPRDLLSINKAAEELGRSTDFVRNEINRKRLAHHRLGGRIYISKADLEEYLLRRRVSAFGENPGRVSPADRYSLPTPLTLQHKPGV
jgi:excisionase family DNA binding protein